MPGLDKTGGRSPELQKYLIDHNRIHPVLRELEIATNNHPKSHMQIPPEQGAFMRHYVKAIKAKKTIEVGVFTGYSTLATALGLPERGKIVACDIDAEAAAIGEEYWEKAGVRHKIDLRIGEADKTLDSLVKNGESGTYDFAFLDANKDKYPVYYEQTLQLLQLGGIAMIDNVFWHGGRVVDPEYQDTETTTLRALNDFIVQDSRVEPVMIGLSDGITLLQKVAS